MQYRWTVAGRPPVMTDDPTFDAPGLGVAASTRCRSSSSTTRATRARRHQADHGRRAVRPDRGARNAGHRRRRPVADPPRRRPSRSTSAAARSCNTAGPSPGAPVVVTDRPDVRRPGLSPGVYPVSLVVVDDSGNESAPDSVQVHVVGTRPIRPRCSTAPARSSPGRDPPDRAASRSTSAARSSSTAGPSAGRTTVVTSGPSFDAPSLGAGTYQAVAGRRRRLGQRRARRRPARSRSRPTRRRSRRSARSRCSRRSTRRRRRSSCARARCSPGACSRPRPAGCRRRSRSSAAPSR